MNSTVWNLTNEMWKQANNFSIDNNATLLNNTNPLRCLQEVNAPSFWKFILLIFPIITVFGNVLVVLAVSREKSLQTVTNYFIVSLAFADIMLAISVMPLAAWVEVIGGIWPFGDTFCDLFVMFDALFCTASILNLAAISIDRFVAVTQPIKYSKNKNAQGRVYMSICLTWVLSISIALPIGIGMNRTLWRDDIRKNTECPVCIFFNPDFLIYSSLGSFYIPCFIMILLYHRIFKVIKARANKQNSSRYNNAFKNTGSKTPTMTSNSTRTMNHVESVKAENATKCNGTHQLPAPDSDLSLSSLTCGGVQRPPIVCSPCLMDADLYEDVLLDGSVKLNTVVLMHDDAKRTEETETCLANIQSQNSKVLLHSNANADLCPLYFEKKVPSSQEEDEEDEEEDGGNGDGGGGGGGGDEEEDNDDLVQSFNTVVSAEPGGARPLQQKVVKSKSEAVYTIFKVKNKKFRKSERSAAKKERKATKTLAIVLGVFLFCWLPFFSMNMAGAFCLKFKSKLAGFALCNIPTYFMSMLVWLGYINSFLNPVIYTIFNVEFRRAFLNILRGSMQNRNRIALHNRRRRCSSNTECLYCCR